MGIKEVCNKALDVESVVLYGISLMLAQRLLS